MPLAPENYCQHIKPAKKTIAWAISCILSLFAGSKIYADPSIAFYYGKPMPIDFLAHFDQVVVEPENIDDIKQLTAKGVTVFAYLSVGEIHPSRVWYSEIPKHWLLGKNMDWESSIVDLTKKDWHNFIINRLMAPLWKRGYRGFFLDTLDSYQLIATTSNSKLVQQKALADLIRTMHQRFPGIKLILNRGFEVLPEIAGYAVAVAAESLFEGWNPNWNRYREVPESDRVWLLKKLNQVHDQYGLQIIVIDYVPPEKKELARKVANRITALGFTPWVTNPSMDMLGIGK